MIPNARSMSAKVFRKMKSFVRSRNGCSQSNFHSLYFPARGNMPKFIDPMFNDASSGRNLGTTESRSSTVISCPPPVVRQIRTSDSFRIPRTISANSDGSELGYPVFGSRAWI